MIDIQFFCFCELFILLIIGHCLLSIEYSIKVFNKQYSTLLAGGDQPEYTKRRAGGIYGWASFFLEQ
jgi:hypothetical protein